MKRRKVKKGVVYVAERRGFRDGVIYREGDPVPLRPGELLPRWCVPEDEYVDPTKAIEARTLREQLAGRGIVDEPTTLTPPPDRSGGDDTATTTDTNPSKRPSDTDPLTS